jgi:hypothetical protein
VIPDRVVKDNEYYEITEIADGAFTDLSTLSGSITLPDTLQVIQTYAFRNLSNVTTITNDVGPIGTSGLNVVTLGGVKAVINTPTFGATSQVQGSCAFGDGLNLDGITTVNANAFNGCDNITGTLTLPSTLSEIGDNAFFDCNKINKILASYTSAPS